MFGNQSLSITFGPVGDILFLSFLILGNGVFSGIIINYIVIEWRSWFDKDEDEKTDSVTHVTYNSYENGAIAREAENDELIEYAQKDLAETEKIFEATGTIGAPIIKFPATDATPEELEAAIQSWGRRPILLENQEPSVEFGKSYIIQWGETENFSQFESTELRRTETPGQTALELLAAYGSGHIRWRLAGDDNTTPEWKYQGFFSADNDKENV